MTEKKERRLTAKQEAFAQACAFDKVSLSEAYRKSGYKTDGMKPKTLWAHALKLRNLDLVSTRIEELQAQIVEKTQLSRAFVIENLMENIAVCTGKKKVTTTGDGGDLEVYKYDPSAANRALELLGKELRMFVDRKEVGGPGDFAKLSDEELDEILIRTEEELVQIAGTMH
jgi:phage terminase small subunit